MMEKERIFVDPHFGFGVDLQKAAQYQLDFLKTVYNTPELRQDEVIVKALWRYENLWLPLMAENPSHSGTLAAPLDIEWIWHCHLLSPLAYEKDCLEITGTLIDHTLVPNINKDALLRESQILWEKKYPKEPFNFLNPSDSNVNVCSDKLRSTNSKISYNIRAALERQKDFFYAVSLPHFQDKKFLMAALERYQKFLFLRQQFPSVFLVPSYDIDLMWHTHQLHPVIYQRDTKARLGRVFNHDDSVNDRSPDSKLSQADSETRDLWKNTFQEPFAMFGAMYRGDPPNGKLQSLSSDVLTTMASKISKITIKQIDIQGLPEWESQLILDMSLLISEYKKKIDRSNTRSRGAMRKLKGSHASWSDENLYTVEFDTLHFQSIQFSLSETMGGFCCSSTEDTGDVIHDITTTVESVYPDGGHVEKLLPLNSSDGLKLRFKATLTPPRLCSIVLTVIPGVYETCVIPETSEQMWGPIPLTRLPLDVINRCDAASHRLVDHHGNLQFTCRTIHSLPLMMSAIHVFYKDKMVVVGHLIGTDQLPLRSQVLYECPSVTPGVGERVILIKNNNGDWGLMFGRWEGFKKGVPDRNCQKKSKAVPSKPGSTGHLMVKLYKMATKEWETIKTDYESSQYDVKINKMTIDIKSGVIKTAVHEAAENLAVALGLGLLHVLCQPRPKDWKPGQTTSSSRGGRSVRSIPSEDMALILAAGYISSAPTNHFLFTTHHSIGNECAWGWGEAG